LSSDLPANVERFSGFADTYDAYRPQPPAVIVDILTQLARCPRPKLVVDLGCGTGLSTRLWSGSADAVTGIDPNPDMLDEAQRRTDAPNVTYRAGMSSDTGLPDGCPDIVTCSQSLHWMEPEPTFAEVARILRAGGDFAAIDCDWPPTTDWEAQMAYSGGYASFTSRVKALEEQHGIKGRVTKWSKDEHLARMRASGGFRCTAEALAHGVEMGNADRLVGLALSQGSVASLLKLGLSEKEIGLEDLRTAAERTLGSELKPRYFGYRIRLGVK
jgi:ubiquinone/menaquinone biosynthesis C-methylase UbiE